MDARLKTAYSEEEIYNNSMFQCGVCCFLCADSRMVEFLLVSSSD